jgi:phosphatidylglycerophosphatase A
MEKLVKFFATGFGLGYSPFASGTVGTLPALLIVIPMAIMDFGIGMQLAVTAALCIIAVPLCSAAESIFGRKDDGRIVADEYMTFSLCLIGIPWLEWPAFLAIAFIVSRIMDIIKPPPARESQALASGIGIVMDDVLANIYALIVNHLIWRYAIVKFVLATT